MRFLASVAVAVLVLSAAVAVDGARPKWHPLTAGYSFERYVADFNKPYKAGTDEYEARRKIFQRKLSEVMAHNADKSQSWKAGVNHLTDATKEELKRMNGGKIHENWKVKEQLRAKPYVRKHKVDASMPLPPQVDYRNHIPSILSAVKDQGMCGSCWAHGSTENVESFAALATGDMYALSQQQVTACAPNPNACGGTGGCGGSIIELAWDYLIQAGGIAQALGLAEDFAQNGTSLAVILGDNVFENCDEQFRRAVQEFPASAEEAKLFFKEREDASRFGVATIADGRLIEIIEKPENPKSNFAQVGFYLYKPAIFPHIKTLTPSARGELELTDLNNIFVRRGTAGYEILSGEWFDTGTLESLHRAHLYFARKRFPPSEL